MDRIVGLGLIVDQGKDVQGPLPARQLHDLRLLAQIESCRCKYLQRQLTLHFCDSKNQKQFYNGASNFPAANLPSTFAVTNIDSFKRVCCLLCVTIKSQMSNMKLCTRHSFLFTPQDD